MIGEDVSESLGSGESGKRVRGGKGDYSRDTGYLDDLEAHTGNISLRLSLATETRDEYLVVLVDEVEATVVWYELRWSKVYA